jgi:hypothetical protein
MGCKKCYDRGYTGFNTVTKRVVVCPDCFEERATKEHVRRFLLAYLLKNIIHTFLLPVQFIYSAYCLVRMKFEMKGKQNAKSH